MKLSFSNVFSMLTVSFLLVSCGGSDSEDGGSGRGGNSPSTNIGGVIVETSNRQEVLDYYNDVYLSSSVSSGWAGDQTTCSQGSTTAAFKKSVLNRINYYRAMAGVPSNILLDNTLNRKAQKAALMMSANTRLDHYPDDSWDCYTAEGDEGAGNSNLFLGRHGRDAVSGYIVDNGGNNRAVGHRRWLLLPQSQKMGTGDIPESGAYRSSNAIWVIDDHYLDEAPASRDGFIAWPTSGYNPYTLVPVRWSFSHPDADLDDAIVTVTQDGVALPVIIDNSNSDIIPTVVWRLNGMVADGSVSWPMPAADTEYDVQISNISVDGESTEFNYTVTVFAP